jgi:SAM-dependent methyltransferase
MRLTDKDRWRYEKDDATLSNLVSIKKREEWLKIVKQYVPSTKLNYLELGCAPGQYSAVLSESTDWSISGIDYSDDSEVFLKTMSLVGKEAELFNIDMFNEKIDKVFDIVISVGLVEHFRGAMLEDVFRLHDYYVDKGGYLIIQIPNFTGFNYFWHYLFDRPDLDNHNIDVMQLQSLEWFSGQGYEILFNDYVGPLRVWGATSWSHIKLMSKLVAGIGIIVSSIALLLDKIGIRLRGRTWSPGILMIARKK